MVTENVNATVGQAQGGVASPQPSVEPTPQPAATQPTTPEVQPTQSQPAQADFQAKMQQLFQELGNPAQSPAPQVGPTTQEQMYLEQNLARTKPQEYARLMEYRRQQAYEQAAGEASRLQAVTRYASTLGKYGVQVDLQRLMENSSSPEALNLEAVKIIAEHAQRGGQPQAQAQPGLQPPRVASVQPTAPRARTQADMTSDDWHSLIARVKAGENVSANDLPQV